MGSRHRFPHVHLYLHVPFCARRCSYCDFAIAVRRDVPSDTYAEAVLREWSDWQHHEIWHGATALETVYFGGGTPSRITPAAIGRILERVAADRAIAAGAEVTLEANPDDVTPESAAAWRAGGSQPGVARRAVVRPGSTRAGCTGPTARSRSAPR